jgi:hypothetical protein
MQKYRLLCLQDTIIKENCFKSLKVFKQEGLTIVHFLNKLIALCKEAVRFPF